MIHGLLKIKIVIPIINRIMINEEVQIKRHLPHISARNKELQHFPIPTMTRIKAKASLTSKEGLSGLAINFLWVRKKIKIIRKTNSIKM